MRYLPSADPQEQALAIRHLSRMQEAVARTICPEGQPQVLARLVL